MKFLRYKESEPRVRYPEDVEKLQKVAYDRGYVMGRATATLVWDAHSDTYAASWLIMDEYTDEDLWRIINVYTEEFDC